MVVPQIFAVALLLLSGVLSFTGEAVAATDGANTVRAVPAGEAVLRGEVKGRQADAFRVRVDAGQTLKVRLKATNRLTEYAILPPSALEPLHEGEAHDSRFEQRVTKSGDYVIRVYLVRAAARRNETSSYVLEVSTPIAPIAPSTTVPSATPSPAGLPEGSFAQSAAQGGVSFFVTSPNAAKGNSVTMTPSGSEAAGLPVSVAVEGVVSSVQAADINADGLPEVYVVVSGRAPDARASLLAFVGTASGLAPIALPPMEPAAARGYLGHDRYAPVDGMMIRTFPVFGKDGDPAAPTGKTRQLHYTLSRGEAGWVLVAQPAFDY